MLPPIPPTDLLPEFRETDWRYCRAIAARGDTYLHLPTLRALVTAAQFEYVEHRDPQSGVQCLRQIDRGPVDVVEFGVRGMVSTWAFLAARPGSLVSVDIADPPSSELDAATACAAEEGVAFEFVRASTLELPPVSCDLLFIDTLHTAAQLHAELERHAAGVRRFIAFHDTMSFGDVGEDGTRPGLQAVVEMLVDGEIEGVGKWELRFHDERCNGLAVVGRVA